MTPYLLVFDLNVQRQAVLDFLDSRREVLNWYAFLPTGVFIISRQTATALSVMLHERFPNVFFIITEIPRTQNNGWLPEGTWAFLNNPRSSGRWD